MIKITIFNEFRHEREDAECGAVYPDGIHAAIAQFVEADMDCEIRCFNVDNVNEGLTEEVLADTDVIIWWGHMAHELVSDDVAQRVANHVLMGMGAVFLHSAHLAKPFKLLMGTACTLKWRDIGEKEILWVVDPLHPIAQGVGECIELEHEECYGEQFDIPEPDALVFIGWFGGGNVFRSGCAYKRGMGRVFYFQPGHEMYPTYKNKSIQKVILNAITWVKPDRRLDKIDCPHMPEPMIGDCARIR